MGYGDMFVVLGHEIRTRYDKEAQGIVTKTEYFIPCVKNTYEEAKDFADAVKGAYHVDIIQLWNPRRERTCRNVSASEYFFRCSECNATDLDFQCPDFCHGCGAKVVEE